MEWIEVSEIRSGGIPFVELDIHDMEIIKEFILLFFTFTLFYVIILSYYSHVNWQNKETLEEEIEDPLIGNPPTS